MISIQPRPPSESQHNASTPADILNRHLQYILNMLQMRMHITHSINQTQRQQLTLKVLSAYELSQLYMWHCTISKIC